MFVFSVPSYILLLLLLILVTSTVGEDAVDEYNQSDLLMMTEDQLEDICIKRGFQLVNDDIDPDTGLVYTLTKQDYVEAAQRCLAIEKEMNDLLMEYPELANDLEDEIKRMEDENAEKQSKVDELENQIASNNVEKDEVNNESVTFIGSSAKSSSNDNNNYNNNYNDDDDEEKENIVPKSTSSSNVAFTRGKEINYDDDENDEHIVISESIAVNDSIADDYVSVDESIVTPINDDIPDGKDEMDSSSTAKSTSVDAATSHNNTETHENVDADVDDDDDDDIHEKFVGTDVEPLQSDTVSASGDGGSIDDDSNTEDFALTRLAIESIRVYVKHLTDAKKRFIKLAIPVMQPLWNAGDDAWRQIKVLYNNARKMYRSFQSSSSPKEVERSESVEYDTCEDDLSP